MFILKLGLRKMSKNALKLKEQSMESGQKTLEEAFDAGKMYQAAKEIKEKVLSGTKRAKRFMVNLFILDIV